MRVRCFLFQYAVGEVVRWFRDDGGTLMQVCSLQVASDAQLLVEHGGREIFTLDHLREFVKLGHVVELG